VEAVIRRAAGQDWVEDPIVFPNGGRLSFPMKSPHPTLAQASHRLVLISLPTTLALGLVLSSCVVPEPQRYGSARVSVSTGYYDRLPDAYDQPYYYSDNRYYYGGAWEQGRFLHNNTYHDSRYLHNGSYTYGGRYSAGRTHTTRTTTSQPHQRETDRDHDRHDNRDEHRSDDRKDDRNSDRSHSSSYRLGTPSRPSLVPRSQG
jgi:hypothetical protein